jgi:hypothetical protein
VLKLCHPGTPVVPTWLNCGPIDTPQAGLSKGACPLEGRGHYGLVAPTRAGGWAGSGYSTVQPTEVRKKPAAREMQVWERRVEHGHALLLLLQLIEDGRGIARSDSCGDQRSKSAKCCPALWSPSSHMRSIRLSVLFRSAVDSSCAYARNTSLPTVCSSPAREVRMSRA